MKQVLDSFGRVDRHARTAMQANIAIEDLVQRRGGEQSLLAFGSGKSYGDSCHNDAGSLVLMRPRNSVIGFDPETGIIHAEAGATLEELIAHAAPHGFFLAVTPGTRFVTLGGAIANDVHGKNHHVRGTFGCHVVGLELLRSDGKIHSCSPSTNAELFAATIGGMGLTGLILSASIQLMPVHSLDVEEAIIPFETLGDYFDIASEMDSSNEYAVAWVDQLSARNRGVLIVGNHASDGNFRAPEAHKRFSIPLDLPFPLLNSLTLKGFNFAYFAAKQRKTKRHVASYGSFFYPLDAVGNWNRLYGSAGFYQHQSVIPFDAAREVIPAMLDASRQSGQASFLTVLKRFGAPASPGILSFPRPGYTLTMDFSNRGAATLALLEKLDRLTVEAKGRVNPYKDQRMSAATFAAGFPEWPQLERHRDPRFNSDFWRRTALALRDCTQAQAAE